MSFQSVNPATGEPLKTYDEMPSDEVSEIIRNADKSFSVWKNISFQERDILMKRAAEVLRANEDHFAELMTLEMGKPILQSKAEIQKCAWVCEFYAENAQKFLADEITAADTTKSYVRYAPLGTVLAVMPWNFPFWQVFRFAAPSLMAGNTAVLKHSSNVPGCALAIESVFKEAGFPEHVFRALMISSKKVDGVIENPLVKAVTLTGSSAAGKRVAQKAGEMLKKTVLELGGSDPFVILDDVDVNACAVFAAQGRNLNSGQSCIAAKRFIVLEKVADEFEKAYAEKMAHSIVGDPMDEKTEVGPMAREDLLEALDEQVQKSVQKGAKVLTGGKRLDREGYFYAPTVLVNVKKGMPVYDEETFGPVAAVIRVKDIEEAVKAANDTPYGLGASVWTKDSAKGEMIAKRFEAGAVFVNGIVKSDPRLPFGGVKQSGYGRELGSHGIKEFVNIQTVWIKS